MKQLFGTILLILFSIQTFQPLFIGLEFELNRDFYASICTNKNQSELECNGCCHLKKQLKENSEAENEKDKEQSKMDYNLFVQYAVVLKNPNYFPTEAEYDFTQCKLLNSCHFDIFHPPR